MSNLLDTPKTSAQTVNFDNICEKASRNERLSKEEGLYLFHHPDEKDVFALANQYRKMKVGESVHYTSTFYVHPTNLCELSCPMCSFYAKPGWKKAWFDTPEDIEKKIRAKMHMGLNEIHIVGGLWRECNLDYYRELFTRIKTISPSFHIKALTSVEYHFLAELHDISIEEVFSRMKSWGLASLPGGGAEILVEDIRKQVAPQKITSQEFLDVHEQAHELDIPSNMTMLFNHVEEYEDIITHLDKVRLLQDKTGGFKSFVPLKYHIENNALGKRISRLKPKSIKRVYAISRLMLDNIPNLKILWNYLGIDLAKEILQAGGNDLASTATEEKIITMAGGVQMKMTKEDMAKIIEGMGRIPKFIHSGEG
jgi:aminodeoxyfutalosine synthase